MSNDKNWNWKLTKHSIDEKVTQHIRLLRPLKTSWKSPKRSIILFHDHREKGFELNQMEEILFWRFSSSSELFLLNVWHFFCYNATFLASFLMWWMLLWWLAGQTPHTHKLTIVRYLLLMILIVLWHSWSSYKLKKSFYLSKVFGTFKSYKNSIEN